MKKKIITIKSNKTIQNNISIVEYDTLNKENKISKLKFKQFIIPDKLNRIEY